MLPLACLYRPTGVDSKSKPQHAPTMHQPKFKVKKETQRRMQFIMESICLLRTQPSRQFVHPSSALAIFYN